MLNFKVLIMGKHNPIISDAIDYWLVLGQAM